MNAPTPGPWTHGTGASRVHVVTERAGPVDIIARDVALADAKIIAAAPDMLAICEELASVECYKLHRDADWPDEDYPEVCEHCRARAVVAKATS